MPIRNIIDNRKRKYRWKTITAIVEPTWHDNSCPDSDQAEHSLENDWGVGYAQNEHCSLTGALTWAETFPGENTLYLYDLGDGIAEVSFDRDPTENEANQPRGLTQRPRG